MTIKVNAMVRIKGCHKVWKVDSLSAGHNWDNAILHRRDLWMGEVHSIHQVWPVSMLQLVAAA